MTGQRRALVVARNPTVSDPVAVWLADAGYVATIVRDYGTARSDVDASPPDLLVAEIKLGSYNGLQLAIRIRSRGLHAPVVLVGDADPVLEAEASRQQAAYLTPPLSPDVLLARLRTGHGDAGPLCRATNHTRISAPATVKATRISQLYAWP